MNRAPFGKAAGFVLIEVLMVMAIISALIAIAIPDYMARRQDARAVACLSNRRNIETDEAGYFAQHQAASLRIADAYQCPNGGAYVWLVSDPGASGYPRVACSIHFTGSEALPDPAPETPAGTTDPATETPAVTPDLAMDDLTEYILSLNLKNKTEDKLIDKLEKALKHFEKGQIEKADNALRSFQKEVDKNSKAIDDETESVLKQKATEIQDMLKQLP